MSFEANSWVWLVDPEEKFLPAKVLSTFNRGESTVVLTEDGEKRKLSGDESSLVVECNPATLDASVHDLVNISDLNEMSILHILRIRFKQNAICK